MKDMIFTVLGGDARQFYLAEKLAEKHSVFLFGFDLYNKNPKFAKRIFDVDSAIDMADFVILPLPNFKGGFLFAPFCESKISIDDLTSKLKNKIIFGGKIDDEFMEKIKDNNSMVFDYLKDESLAIFNGVLTAEGAVAEAIENYQSSIFESCCLITGYGRIGKVLAKYLKNMGAEVFITARKKSDLAYIRSNGYNSLGYDELSDYIGKFDIIFNTVPFNIFDEAIIKKSKSDMLFIELASAPYGINPNMAKNLNINLIKASGLPGIYSPKKSGEIICDVIEKIVWEEKYG